MLEILAEAGCEKTALPALRVTAGTHVEIVGCAASGKTRFCLALAGLDEQGEAPYRILIDGHPVSQLSPTERATTISFVPSDASLALSNIMANVRAELELAWRLLDHQPSDHEIEVHARQFGLDALLQRHPLFLSGGETTRLALAIATVKKPKLLILDQVLDHLDVQAVAAIRSALFEVLPQSSIIVETRSRRTAGNAAQEPASQEYHDQKMGWHIILSDRAGGASPGSFDVARQPLRLSVPRRTATAPSGTGSALLKVQALAYRYGESGFALGPIDLSINAGERIALVAPSGSGKTTLLKCLALLLQPSHQLFEVQAPGGARVSPPVRNRHLHLWAHQALYCFQRPEDQLYLPTVRGELLETARRLSRSNDMLALEIADEFGLATFLDKSPFDLPRPHRRLLTIASALAARSPLLLLDEPSAMLDDGQVERLAHVLNIHAANSAVLMVSHDYAFLERAATTVLHLHDMGTCAPTMA